LTLQSYIAAVHTILEDLLPKNVYFRFNPPLRTDIPLDEADEENLDKLVVDALHYLDKKKGKIQAASAAISLEKTLLQDWRERLQDNYLLIDRM
jgi:calcium-independent phospholipase A2-gamma